MKIVFLILGVFLVGFGIVDLVGSYANFDLWGSIGIELPDLLWKYSSYIEIAVGAILFNIGRNSESEFESDSEASTV